MWLCCLFYFFFSIDLHFYIQQPCNDTNVVVRCSRISKYKLISLSPVDLLSFSFSYLLRERKLVQTKLQEKEDSKKQRLVDKLTQLEKEKQHQKEQAQQQAVVNSKFRKEKSKMKDARLARQKIEKKAVSVLCKLSFTLFVSTPNVWIEVGCLPPPHRFLRTFVAHTTHPTFLSNSSILQDIPLPFQRKQMVGNVGRRE